MENNYVDIHTLTGWDKNPREIDKAGLTRLKKQIEKHGQFKPLIVTKDFVVIGGNMRLKAMKEMGVEKVWISIVKPKDEADMVAIALADNDRAGSYLEDALTELVAGFPEIDWNDYHVDLGDTKSLQDLLKAQEGEVIEDEVPELPETPKSKLGDVYQLGSHRLMCGDSTDSLQVQTLMGGSLADMVFTDPPYNVDYEGSDGQKIQNDKMNDGMFADFLHKAFQTMCDATKSGSPIYVCHADSEGLNFRKAMIESGWLLKQAIIWVKNSMVMGRQDYQWQHEPILYGWKPGAAHKWYGMFDKKTVIDDNVDLEKLNKAQLVEILKEMKKAPTTVVRENKPQKNDLHPTMKPLNLVAYFLRNSSKKDDVVLDTFLGSGSTLMACEQTDRVCYGMELDPKYIDVIITRWETFTGDKAVKVSV